MNLLTWLRGLFTAKRRTVGTISGTPPIAGPVSHVFVVDPDVTLAESDKPENIAAGLQAQLREDLAPHWGTDPSDVVRASGTPVPREIKICVHGPAPTQPQYQGALAVHDHDEDGTPIVHCWYELIQQYGASLSSAVSHELIEARLDPEGDRTVILPDGREAALEDCDAVEQLTYRKLGAEVSDWNTKSNFGIDGSAPPFDFLGKVERLFQVLPGGYAQVLTSEGWQQLQPDERTTASTGLAAYHAHLHRLGLSRRARRARKHAAKHAKRAPWWHRLLVWLSPKRALAAAT